MRRAWGLVALVAAGVLIGFLVRLLWPRPPRATSTPDGAELSA